jgi:hypothetical protein
MFWHFLDVVVLLKISNWQKHKTRNPGQLSLTGVLLW